MSLAGIVVGLLIAAASAVAVALYTGRLVIPDEWNPWAPLRIDEAPNLLTRYKLQRLSAEPALCKAVLESAEMRFEPLPDRPADGAAGTEPPGCGWRDAVRVSATSLAVGTPFVLSCPAAVSLALWEKHVVQPAARQHFGEPATGMTQWGSFACRNLYGRADASRSQHATAQALDVAGFRLADGRRISVLRQWPGDAPEALFLRDVHAGACRFFDAVLGPEYNAAHRDHLHLDRGRYRACR